MVADVLDGMTAALVAGVLVEDELLLLSSGDGVKREFLLALADVRLVLALGGANRGAIIRDGGGDLAGGGGD